MAEKTKSTRKQIDFSVFFNHKSFKGSLEKIEIKAVSGDGTNVELDLSKFTETEFRDIGLCVKYWLLLNTLSAKRSINFETKNFNRAQLREKIGNKANKMAEKGYLFKLGVKSTKKGPGDTTSAIGIRYLAQFRDNALPSGQATQLEEMVKELYPQFANLNLPTSLTKAWPVFSKYYTKKVDDLTLILDWCSTMQMSTQKFKVVQYYFNKVLKNMLALDESNKYLIKHEEVIKCMTSISSLDSTLVNDNNKADIEKIKIRLETKAEARALTTQGDSARQVKEIINMKTIFGLDIKGTVPTLPDVEEDDDDVEEDTRPKKTLAEVEKEMKDKKITEKVAKKLFWADARKRYNIVDDKRPNQ